MLSPARDGQLEVVHLHLPCDSAAPAAARAALCKMAGIDSARDDALLVASEIVTNAVLHSGAEQQDLIDVVIERREDALLISVLDPGVRGGVAEIELRSRPHGGWGLRVVEQLARAWGRERSGGYLVWAELAL